MGFAAGFQAGSQAVERALRRREEEQERERIKAAMGLTAQEVEQRQATPDELGRARAETEAMAAEDARVFGLTPQEQVSYAPQMPAEGQRIGLSRYQVGQQIFDRMPTQSELETVRYGAAANVLAERDPVAAQRMRRELQLAKREDELYPLQRQQLEGALAGQAQQRDLTGLQIKAANRTEAELQNASNFANFAAERPDATAVELKEAAFKQFKFTPKQWQDAVTTRLGIENAEMDSFKNNIKKKLQGKNLTQLGSLYNSDPDFDDKTDLAIVPGKGGAVTLNFIDKASKRVTGTQTFKNEALATEYLNKQATEPETLGSWMLNLNKAEAAINASNASAGASAASVRASDANIGLTNARRDQVTAQTKILNTNVENNTEARKIQTDLANLDDENDPTGSRRANLIAQFNMLAVGPGKTIPAGGGKAKATSILKQPVEQKKNDDGTYTAFSKDGGQALYNTLNGEALPLGMTATEFQAMKDAAKKNGVELYRTEDNGKLGLGFVGPDGKPYSDPEKAKRSKAPAPEKEETPAPAAKSGIDTSKTSKANVSSAEAPPVKKSISYGTTLYTIPGVSGTFKSEQAAKAAWADKNKNKLSFND